jgi:hypothetical protein
VIRKRLQMPPRRDHHSFQFRRGKFFHAQLAHCAAMAECAPSDELNWSSTWPGPLACFT